MTAARTPGPEVLDAEDRRRGRRDAGERTYRDRLAERVGDKRVDAVLADEIAALIDERRGYLAKPDTWEPKKARIAAVEEQIRVRGGTVPKA